LGNGGIKEILLLWHQILFNLKCKFMKKFKSPNPKRPTLCIAPYSNLNTRKPNFNLGTISRLCFAAFIISFLPYQCFGTIFIGPGLTTKSSNWSPGDNVEIQAGGVLQINSGVTVTMPANDKITVDPNGELKAVGTSLSNVVFTCSSGHWAGIEILGNPSTPWQPSIASMSSMTIGTSTNKGCAYLDYCTIQNCNYGTVCGSIIISSPYNYLKIFAGTSKGGGVLFADNCTYQYFDYVGIAFSPLTSASNNSIIENNHIYLDYNNTGAMGIALFGIGNMPIEFNYLRCRLYSTTVNIFNIKATTFGIYVGGSGMNVVDNTFVGFQEAVDILDNTGTWNKLISGNTFTNNVSDISTEDVYHTTVYDNSSTKNTTGVTLTSKTIGGQFFDAYFGNDFSIIDNNVSVSHRDNYINPLALWYVGSFAPTGNLTQYNVMNTYFNGIENSAVNTGMQYTCNEFINTAVDIYDELDNDGSPQGSPTLGRANTWHTGCTGNSQWQRAAGVGAVNYYWKTFGQPVCDNISEHGAGTAPPTCTYTMWLSSPNLSKNDLNNTMTALGTLPAYPYLMTGTQLDDYKSLNFQRDFDLSQLIQYYEDTAMYDSAFYTMSAYPCLKSDLDKINLLIALDSSYASYSTLETNISNDLSLCSSGSGHCDNMYYDSTSSALATTYYPMYIDLKKHYFSDSVISAYSTTLTTIANDSMSFFAGSARSILQTQADSFFTVYMPHDSDYSYPVLYPESPGIPDTSGGEAPELGIKVSSVGFNSWKIYPNPASTSLSVSSSDADALQGEAVQYRIYSLLGSEVLSGTIDQMTTAINISLLDAGEYVLKLSTKNGTKSFNFVRQ